MDGQENVLEVLESQGQAASEPEQKEAQNQGKNAVASLVMPGTDAKPEEWDTFYKALGRPDTPEGYTLPQAFSAEGLSDEVVAKVNEVLAADKLEITALAHKIGLSGKQAERLYNEVGGLLAATLAKQADTPAVDVDKVLATVWPTDTQKNLALAKAGVQGLGIGTALDEAGLSTNPLVLQMAHALGKVTAEHGLKGDPMAGGALASGKEAYDEMLSLIGSEAYQRQDPATVRKVEQLSARAKM